MSELELLLYEYEEWKKTAVPKMRAIAKFIDEPMPSEEALLEKFENYINCLRKDNE